MWSQRAEEIVSRLITGLPPAQLDPARTHSARLRVLHIGGSMWADYYLRPNGAVVVVGEEYDQPDVGTVHTDRSNVLMALVWGGAAVPGITGADSDAPYRCGRLLLSHLSDLCRG
ncbi:hypothetical protein VT84_11910 [Gemmata sp. SH-PL17]|uniref:hypothetical protein n=1 Tax=Gemmata sp. SH-PL17 TaxID=1630693 RepID=UPI00078ED69D|nr:hypothetical protein [Gemmata sp. SH-PL17]AMV25094.1 hypothetical protein VT84_11910 [Gemmata sp. SH-PL17]